MMQFQEVAKHGLAASDAGHPEEHGVWKTLFA